MNRHPQTIHIKPSQIQPLLNSAEWHVDMLREDLNHPLIQGNKFRKLKYNLLQAWSEKKNTLLTFGGAFSNHIHATAAAGNAFGFETIGVIRGEELAAKPLNPTLREAQALGMKLEFISRQDYKEKDSPSFLTAMQKKFPDAFILPEGGTNTLAVKGCEEILDERTKGYDYICLPVGTAGTLAGVLKAVASHQKVLGFPALKGADFLHQEIKKYTDLPNYDLINAYHFGGYAKFSSELISFVNQFSQDFLIPLDPIYTGKMMYGVMDMIQNQMFDEGARILVIHTGGLQGVRGFNEKNINMIKVNNI